MRKVKPRRFGNEWWVGQFTWESIAAWRWRVKTSKSKYHAAAEFDLTLYSLLLPLLESVPHAERAGPIVTEGGLPVRESSYRKWFRVLARAAGIPDDVQLMDTRAGGITEADDAGVDRDFIQDAATHADKGTTLRYIRRRTRRIAAVADARRRSRESDGTA